MDNQETSLNTNQASLSMDDVLSGKLPQAQAPETKEAEPKTKAEEQPSTTKTEEPKTDPEVEKLQKRLQDTQKWGNAQREATLRIIKNLRDKGLSDDDIAETVGGKEVFDKVLKGVPAEQELSDKNSVVANVYQQQIGTVAAAMMEMGHTKEELEEFVNAFNTIAADSPDHRDELYRRATSGEGNVAAYALKVGKEVLEEYRLSQQIKVKGVKTWEQELREKIKAELAAEMANERKAIQEELGQPAGKPRLVGGSTNTDKNEPAKTVDFKDIFGR